MNPDVVAAIARLRAQQVLSAPQAVLLGRVARGALVSVRLELRALLYAGVLLLTSGVGLLIAAHHQRIGPWALASAIGLAAAACLAWVVRRAPTFSWGEVAAPGVAFEYVLLLGLLLLAADLAYVEAQFALLGPAWPHHLLVVGVLYVAAAYRWDSAMILGLGLATLAAWRGVSIGLVHGELAMRGLRVDALALGALYVGAAALAVRLARKAHFEPVLATAGLVLALGALVSGALERGPAWPGWLAALLPAAGLVTWLAFRLGRSVYFALGVLAAYAGLLRLLFAPFHAGSSLALLLAALLGLGALALVFAAHRRMAER